MMLKPGSVSNFENSMAKAMADAFQTEWNAVKDFGLGDAGEEDRKILFAAIAQGVVKHLQEKINEALKVEIKIEVTNEKGTSTKVELLSE